MRTVSAELAAAIEATERTIRVTASVDWDGDGHGGTGTGPPLLIRDTFDRNPVAAAWGTATSGLPWTSEGGSASDHSTTGTVGRHLMASVNVSRRGIIGPSMAGGVVTARVRPSAVATGAPITGMVMARYVDSSNHYQGQARFLTDGTVAARLVSRVAAVDTNLGEVVLPSLTYAANSWWWISIGYTTSGLLRLKVWPDGAEPPLAWTVTATNTAVTAAAPVGVRSLLVTGNTNTNPTVDYDDVRVVTGAVDDISGRLGGLTISRALTGQLPDEVLVVEGLSAATATGSLVTGATDDEQLGAVQYWSRLNQASPLHGKPRANRDAQAAVEFLTSTGWQSVPLLTQAVLRSLPVSVADRAADLELIDARDRLREPVTLPAFTAEEPYDGVNLPSLPGLEAAWPVSLALWTCGLPLSPPPRAGCRLFIPMHGSAMPFIGRQFVGGPDYAYTTSDFNTTPDHRMLEFSDDAPFFLASVHRASDPAPRTRVHGYALDTGPVVWDTSGRSSGRVEVWAKIPALPSDTARAVYLDLFSPGAGGLGFSDPNIEFRILRDGTTRLFINASTSLGVSRTITGPTYTHDGAWHLFGVHWDDVAGSATFRRDSTNDVVAYTPIPAGDTPITAAVLYTVEFGVAAAEFQLTAGITAATAWQPLTWSSGVVADRPQNRRLMGIYPADKPQEAWEVLTGVYGAERGLVVVDVDGAPNLWTSARLNTTDALNPVRTVTSSRDLLSLGYRDDRDMVRNIIRVQFKPLTISASGPVWSLTGLVRIDPGQTWTADVTLERPLASAVTVSGNAHANADGSGSSWQINPVSAVRGEVTVTSPTTVRVAVTSSVAQPVFLVDSLGVPDVQLVGQTLTQGDPVPVEVRGQPSIDEFGANPLDVPDSPWCQTRGWALGTAYGLLALLQDEQVVFDGLEVPGDPRLEPLDRLRVQDSHGLALDTEVTLQMRSDRLAGGGYTCTLVARPARDQWLLGGPGVGTPLGSTILGGTP